MAKGKKTGGRVKGTLNKATADVQAKLDALGCDPIAGMARIAMRAEKAKDDQLAGRMYAELAGYIAPKRKAIEVSPGGGSEGYTLSEIIATYRKATDG